MERLLVVTLCVVGVLAARTGVVYAHGERTVGPLEWTVGWAEEPAFVGSRNAVDLALSRGGSPVTGADADLRVEVILGDESTEPLELRAEFGSPGSYLADLIPTAPGDYTFHFTGTLDGASVDESFTGSEDGFDEVTGTGDIAFPAAAPSTTELARRLASVERTAEDAKGAAGVQRVLSIVAVVLSVVALASSSRRRRPAS